MRMKKLMQAPTKQLKRSIVYEDEGEEVPTTQKKATNSSRPESTTISGQASSSEKDNVGEARVKGPDGTITIGCTASVADATSGAGQASNEKTNEKDVVDAAHEGEDLMAIDN
jgi:hypothetical protein